MNPNQKAIITVMTTWALIIAGVIVMGILAVWKMIDIIRWIFGV